MEKGRLIDAYTLLPDAPIAPVLEQIAEVSRTLDGDETLVVTLYAWKEEADASESESQSEDNDGKTQDNDDSKKST
jgi:hypothetical protein